MGGNVRSYCTVLIGCLTIAVREYQTSSSRDEPIYVPVALRKSSIDNSIMQLRRSDCSPFAYCSHQGNFCSPDFFCFPWEEASCHSYSTTYYSTTYSMIDLWYQHPASLSSITCLRYLPISGFARQPDTTFLYNSTTVILLLVLCYITPGKSLVAALLIL